MGSATGRETWSLDLGFRMPEDSLRLSTSTLSRRCLSLLAVFLVRKRGPQVVVDGRPREASGLNLHAPFGVEHDSVERNRFTEKRGELGWKELLAIFASSVFRFSF